MTEDVLRLMVTSYPEATKKEDNKGRIPLHFAVGGNLKKNVFTISMFQLLCRDGAASHPDEKGKSRYLRLDIDYTIFLSNTILIQGCW